MARIDENGVRHTFFSLGNHHLNQYCAASSAENFVREKWGGYDNNGDEIDNSSASAQPNASEESACCKHLIPLSTDSSCDPCEFCRGEALLEDAARSNALIAEADECNCEKCEMRVWDAADSAAKHSNCEQAREPGEQRAAAGGEEKHKNLGEDESAFSAILGVTFRSCCCLLHWIRELHPFEYRAKSHFRHTSQALHRNLATERKVVCLICFTKLKTLSGEDGLPFWSYCGCRDSSPCWLTWDEWVFHSQMMIHGLHTLSLRLSSSLLGSGP
ncbi:hypothetical protein AXG93_4295s1530 [Marchantia polymorpha subsp. ruderalis]|uniref:Uncharacterized protein n=1 Tax=Marchantia polymorpha subsp. ruderalis TaxID=1480154 RepID=A0A176WAQ3_MARPO|nr:hypothetical protein AXG93_4295s1530 [Marchantia polymorpha subsp. ruderalis]